jgi:hypothetical protein
VKLPVVCRSCWLGAGLSSTVDGECEERTKNNHVFTDHITDGAERTPTLYFDQVHEVVC